MAYFAMASDMGWIAIDVEFTYGGPATSTKPTRQIFWARYVSW